MTRFATLLLSLALCSAMPALARIQLYQSSWESSSWTNSGNARVCTLTHDIPRFGQARFEQHSGRRLEFSLHVSQPPVRDQSAQIFSEAPPWKHGVTSYPLGDFRLQQGKTPLALPRDQALRLFYELEQGMKPIITFADWGDGKDQVQVGILPVRFREALPAFLECTAGLLYLDFEPLSERTVYFATASSQLSRATRRVLENVAREYRKNTSTRIVLGGHADARGAEDYNLQLSSRRAKMVSRYLRSRGVAAGAIQTRHFGESLPAVDGDGQSAWARNRRVTVWLAEK